MMCIDFDSRRWEKVKETYKLWWGDKLDRPVIPIVLVGPCPDREKPAAPVLSQKNCNDFTYSPDEIVDALDYELARYTYLGDAFPYINLDCFGPGLLAAFLGAELNNATGNVWFSVPEIKSINDLHFEYDQDNVWLKRVRDICSAAMKKWNGLVLVGMPDLGGCLDILATFRTTEGLLTDLYDHPGEVKRLIWEIHDLWHQYYNEINSILFPANPGYSDWSSVYSDRPSYVIQCDFSYMISPSMFCEFAKPEIEESGRKLGRSIFHLDGPGELGHLDYLLEMEYINVIQWVPGAGNPNESHWPEVYRKIREAGRKIQVWEGFDSIDEIKKQTGTWKGIQNRVMYRPVEEEAMLRKRLLTYGIE